MATDRTTNIHNHGIEVDTKKKRVKCNYCEKVVSGFYRLKCHLAGRKGDVTRCLDVPEEVKDLFGKQITEAKMKRLCKMDDNQNHPNLPLKRKLSLKKYDSEHKKADIQINIFEGQHSFEVDSLQITGAKTRASTRLGYDNADHCSTRDVRNSFYSFGNDFNAILLPRFQEMVSTPNINGQPIYNNLSCHELRLCLDNSLIQTHNYVNYIKETSKITGCSILLDDWVDSKNQVFVNIFVSCPKGVIYLKSFNISTLVGNVDIMVAFLEEVIQEVGITNVVQIIRNSNSDIMDIVKTRIKDKHAHIFWTLSASKCIELMLEKFSAMQLVEKVFKRERTILDFIHNNATTVKKFSTLNLFDNLIKPSKIKALLPYLTLESIMEKKEILKELFASSEWRASNLSASPSGKNIADIVKSTTFWEDAGVVLKASLPLLDMVRLSYENDNPLTGYIYEHIERAKLKIQKELKHKVLYDPFWSAIDEIWDRNLHSHLHSAGYFLNTSFYYSNNFHSTPVVASGVSYISCMIADQHVKSLVRFQIAEYIWMRRTCNKSKLDNPENSSPANWWLTYEGKFPELKDIAVRFISQTSDGACKFGLHRDLSEMLLENGGGPFEQQMLKDLAFVHYNMQLCSFYSNKQ